MILQKYDQLRTIKRNGVTHDIHFLFLDLLVDFDDPHQRESCNRKRISIVFERLPPNDRSVARLASNHEELSPRLRLKLLILNYSGAAGVVDTLIRG